MEPTHILATRIDDTRTKETPTAHDVDAFYNSHGFEWYAALTRMFSRRHFHWQQLLARGETTRHFAPETR